MSRDVMQQALDALIEIEYACTDKSDGMVLAAITALRAALAQRDEPVALGALAHRRVFDAIRGAYDLGYNNARNNCAEPGDSAPGYKGREVEQDHGGALLHALAAPQPAPVAQPEPVPLTDAELDKLRQGADQLNFVTLREFRIIARAAERAHKIGGAL